MTAGDFAVWLMGVYPYPLPARRTQPKKMFFLWNISSAHGVLARGWVAASENLTGGATFIQPWGY